MKTINELNEITSLDSNTYVAVSKGGGESAKFNLSSLDTDLLNNALGLRDSVEEFSTLKKYYPGQLVLYQDKVYKFTEQHSGPWSLPDVTETDFFYELSGIVQGASETLHIQISYSDNLTSGANQTVIVSYDSLTIPINTDSEGKATINIPKGKVYSLEVSDMIGYSTPGYSRIVAQERDRYINLIYYAISTIQTSNLTVKISTNGLITDFINGNSIVYLKDGNDIVDNQNPDSNCMVTFSNIEYGSYTLEVLFTTTTIQTYDIGTKNIVIQFPIQQTTIEANVENSGLFLVNGNDWSETELTQEFIDALTTDMKDTYVAIHVCPKVLLDSGNDYYVRCRDLTSERLATESTTRQWQTTYQILLPHVSTSTTDFIGQTNTYYMIYDSVNLGLGISSPAAIFATSQHFHGMPGFIGTRAQMDIIYGNISNRTTVINTLTKLGYSDINFISSRTWSSTQQDASNSLLWDGTRWYPYYGAASKPNSLLVVPFFAVL